MVKPKSFYKNCTQSHIVVTEKSNLKEIMRKVLIERRLMCIVLLERRAFLNFEIFIHETFNLQI